MTDLAAGEKKAWQKGIPLERLKRLAEPFKLAYKPYCHGQFGCPKERDIADALADNGLAYVADGPDRYGAVAIFGQLKAASRQRDFTGKEFSIPDGDLLIKHLVYRDDQADAGRKLLAHLLKADCPAVWLELHEENDGFKALAERAGFRWVATKVSAGSDIRGVYVAGRDAKVRSYLSRTLDPAEHPGICCMMPGWLTEDCHKAILAELAQYEQSFHSKFTESAWAGHYSDYGKRGSWAAFALRGYDPADPGYIVKPAEMSKEWKAENPAALKLQPGWTPAWDAFPAVQALFDEFLMGPKDRVRFMRLAGSHGELARHADITDREAGVADGKVTRLHIPLRTNTGVEFESWDIRGQRRTMHMAERGLYYLDQRKPHACKNLGQQERIHLVVDMYGQQMLRQLIAKGAADADRA